MVDFLKLLGPRNQARRDRDWFSMRNQADEAEVWIYDFIGFDPWFGGVAAKDFVQELRGITSNKILLRINSPGGAIDEAVAIRNALQEHPATVETRIDGLAASSASWVGLSMDKVVMGQHATLMIHEPWNVMAGDAESFRKEAEILDMFADQIADMYVEKAGGEKSEWRDLMRAETWYTDQEAVDAGLADEIAGDASTAENRYDPSILTVFKNTPQDLLPKPSRQARSPKSANMPHPDNHLAALEFARDQAKRTMSRLSVA